MIYLIINMQKNHLITVLQPIKFSCFHDQLLITIFMSCAIQVIMKTQLPCGLEPSLDFNSTSQFHQRITSLFVPSPSCSPSSIAFLPTSPSTSRLSGLFVLPLPPPVSCHSLLETQHYPPPHLPELHPLSPHPLCSITPHPT